MRLKNITASSVSLQMYNTDNPMVNFVSTPVILTLAPGADVPQASWLVTNITDPSYNLDIINNYVSLGILSQVIG